MYVITYTVFIEMSNSILLIEWVFVNFDKLDGLFDGLIGEN